MAIVTIKPASGHEALTAYLAEPSDEVKGGIILIHEVWGLDDHIRDVADRFAREGYVTVAPDLLGDHRITDEVRKLQTDLFDPVKRNEAQPRLRELMAPLHDDAFVRQAVASLKACFDTLQERDDVGGRIAAVGFSFGGTYAYQLAAEEPLIKAVVPFYGHAPLTEGKLNWITCPVLAFYGEHDERLVRQLPEVEQAMSDANVGFEARVYDTAGHAFFNDDNPQAYNREAAEDAWQRTLEFLQRNVADAPLET